MCVQNLKFVALPVPEIRVQEKIRQSVDMPTLPFLQNFNGFLFRWTGQYIHSVHDGHYECTGQI